jgi:hypothetical protein
MTIKIRAIPQDDKQIVLDLQDQVLGYIVRKEKYIESYWPSGDGTFYNGWAVLDLQGNEIDWQMTYAGAESAALALQTPAHKGFAHV